MTHLMMGFLLVGPKTGPDVGKASPVGLLIVVLLLIGVFVLVWSMNRHLKRLPTSFDTEAPAQETPDDAPPADPKSDAERPAHESGS